MLDHKVLLFLMEPGQIHPNIAGLVANRIMGKYQRPVCVLTKQVITEKEEEIITCDITEDGSYGYPIGCNNIDRPGGKAKLTGIAWAPAIRETDIIQYAGSARGCDITGITEFKSICYETGVIEWAVGHEGAFGLCIKEENIEKFLEKTDEILAQYPDEACYHVDYLWEGDHADGQIIEDIAGYGFLWGKDMPESKVGIKNLKITKDNISLKSADKNPTLCISLPECEIIKFGSSKEEYESLRQEDGFTTINLVGTCGKNEWMGTVTPQIMLEDYEIVNSSKYYF
jgi:single-stranded DNA-specific DHH superfamily exonuclease